MKERQTKWMKFLGGNNIIFTFVLLLLIGAIVLLYSQLDFILRPIVTVLSTVITPLVLSFILYYLIDPLVDFLESKKIKRLWAIIGIYVAFAGLLTLLILWLIPTLQQQFSDLVQSIPTLFENLTNFIREIFNNISQNADQQNALNEALGYFDNIETNFMNYLSEGFSSVGNIISSVTNVFVILLMVPIILFFLLKDGSQFMKGLMGKIPPGSRKDIASILRAIDTQVGGYIKGQIIIAIVNGVLMFLGFSLIGLNYNGVLAVAGGILSFIPYLGPTLTFVPAAVIALTDSFWMVGQLTIVWAIIQFIEGDLVEPNVLGRSLNVHPVTIIFILLIMSELLGLIGMILGVPIYAILKVFVTYAFQKFKARYNKYYGTEKGMYEEKSLEDIYKLED
jgi:predicted PurR-regulated permease PerM